MRYASSILDVFDDKGTILKQCVPDPDQIPSFVKEASEISPDTAPANQFALVLLEDGQLLKKYATAGPGHTWLSSLYFDQTASQLPDQARRTAATFLKQACEAYGLPVIETVEKLAMDQVPHSNVVDVLGDSFDHSENLLETTFGVERMDGSTALPLDNAGAVAAADRYFSGNHGDFTPRKRREFAVKVAAANEVPGFTLCRETRAYSGSEYSPNLKSAITARRVYLTADDADPDYMRVFDKVAAQAEHLPPDDFADLLSEFDQAAELDKYWDRGIPDPWYSTFGMLKEAKGAVEAPKTLETDFGNTITEDDVIKAAQRRYSSIAKHFGQDFARKFAAEPVAVFKSLPAPQKKFIGRLCSDLANS